MTDPLIVTVTQEVVGVSTSVEEIDINMGVQGPQGPVGAAGTAAATSSTFAGLPAPTAGEIRRVTDNVRGLWYADGSNWVSVVAERLNPMAFGAKGDDTTDDTVALQAMADQLATSTGRVSEVEFPPGIYKISAPIDFGYVSGKIIRGSGSNPFNSPSASGTRIVQTANNVPIFKIGGGGSFPRAIRLRDISLAYTTQQTSADTAAMGLQFSGPIPHDIELRDVTVERACDSLGAAASSTQSWNIYLVNVRLWHQARHAIWFPNTGGSPQSRFENLFICNTNGGPVPTGVAIRMPVVGLTIDGLDVEGWNNTIMGITSGYYVAIRGLHVEWHTFSGAHPFIFDVANIPLWIRNAAVSLNPVQNEAFTGTAILFRVWDNGGVDLDHIRLDLPSAVTGNVLLTGGPGLDAKSRIGNYIRNYGPNAVKIADGSSDLWGGHLKIRRDLRSGVTALTYGPTIATAASPGLNYRITVTNGTAFTISNPTGAKQGEITYDILNSSGGAMGAITWGADFKLAGAFTNPANTKRRTITFYGDNTNWVEKYRAAADI